MNKKVEEATSRALTECLKISTGLPVRRTSFGAEIELNGSWCSCQTIFESFADTEDGVLSAAVVRFILTKEIIIEDQIVGVGESITDSAISAIEQFVNGIVVPVAAISNKLSPDHSGHEKSATTSKLTHNGLQWSLSLSQVISNDATGKLYKVVDQEPPMNILWHALEQKMKTPSPHWAKLYLCRYPEGDLDGDVFIDNEPDEQALEALLSFTWPTDQELIWFRQFCYLEPVGFRQNFSPNLNKNPFNLFAKTRSS